MLSVIIGVSATMFEHYHDYYLYGRRYIIHHDHVLIVSIVIIVSIIIIIVIVFTMFTGVCEKNTPPQKKTLWEISLKSTKSGTGEQFLPLDCHGQGWQNRIVFFTDDSKI